MIKSWLKRYNIESEADAIHARREIVQEIALSGLKRSGLLTKAAFYGGTALRIFHGIDRYSEDLDFTLLRPNKEFTLSPYLKDIANEFTLLGLNVELTIKKKKNVSAIESAFLKENTEWATLNIDQNEYFPGHKQIKVKIEVDKDPPLKFNTEPQLLLLPFSQYINCLILPDLFAGKMHALLFRKWVNNVKGRDWYDLVWYIKNGIELNMIHFNARAEASNDLIHGQPFDKKTLNNILQEKIESLDINMALRDIQRYVDNGHDLQVWNRKYFYDVIKKIRTSLD